MSDYEEIEAEMKAECTECVSTLLFTPTTYNCRKCPAQIKKEIEMSKVMATTQKKWSDNMLRQFYAELRAQFGQHKYWQYHSCPGNIQKRKFNSFMDAFNVAFHVAPKSQLAWATTHQAKIGLCSKGKPQTYNQRNYMRNKLAAYDAGFIGKEYFADEIFFKNHYPVHGMGIAALNAKIEEGLADAAEQDILEYDI